MACMAYEVMRRPKGGGMLIEHSIRDGNTKQARKRKKLRKNISTLSKTTWEINQLPS